ncbi:MAG TPA: Cof-type HAD-IIB family hydrolase [Opitutaceae bacterium]
MNAGIEGGPAGDLRLAAIDLDGTLLSPDLTISEANRRAIAHLRKASVEVVLASGRHFESIRPFALQLPEVRWIVSAQGGEVSDVERSVVLSRTFLEPHETQSILEVGKRLGMAAMVYTPAGILTDAEPSEETEFYARLSGNTPISAHHAELTQGPVYKILWIGEEDQIATLREEEDVVALNLQTLRTHTRILELMPVGVSKATGLGVLVEHLGLSARHAVAFGDAENDVPMFDWAAASVAMPHGWPIARQRARWIAPPGPAETAFARAVDLVFEERLQHQV